jgi:transposase
MCKHLGMKFRKMGVIPAKADPKKQSKFLIDQLIKLKQAYTDMPLTLVMDNARYQRCNKVTEQAEVLGIDILFLPPYSPNSKQLMNAMIR